MDYHYKNVKNKYYNTISPSSVPFVTILIAENKKTAAIINSLPIKKGGSCTISCGGSDHCTACKFSFPSALINVVWSSLFSANLKKYDYSDMFQNVNLWKVINKLITPPKFKD